MKARFIFIPLILLVSLSAKAFDGYEDAPEFLQEIPSSEAALEATEFDTTESKDRDPYPELKAAALKQIRGKGTWAFKFVLLRPDGTSTLLSEYRARSPMKPASTLKLFTGWMGFNQNAKSDEFLAHMLQLSDNTQANQTLNKVGGAQRMVQYYKKKKLPLNDSNFKAVDGCGLSHSNRVTVDLEIDLLELIRQDDQYHEFKEMLAQPGDTGTLQHRFSTLDDRLYGKTGTLRDTAALAGFVELENGTLLFSVLSNQLKISLPAARAIIDTLVEDHATFAETLAPEVRPELFPVVPSFEGFIDNFR